MGNVQGARQLLNQSMNLKPSVHAARNLATFAPTADDAAKGYQHAWQLWEKLSPEAPNVAQLGADLSSEIAGWLLGNGRFHDLEDFLKRLHTQPRYAPFLQKDKVLHARAALAVNRSDYATALPILRHNCFPTYGSLRAELI